MDSLLPVPAAATLHRVRQIQTITIAWMSVEAVVSLLAARMAHSPVLLAFGGDSAIELVSAVVIYWQFRSKRSDERTEELAARITGSLLFALSAYVALVAALALRGHREVRPSYLVDPFGLCPPQPSKPKQPCYDSNSYIDKTIRFFSLTRLPETWKEWVLGGGAKYAYVIVTKTH